MKILKNFIMIIFSVIITITTVWCNDVFPENTLERVVGCVITISCNVIVELIIFFFQDKIIYKLNK